MKGYLLSLIAYITMIIFSGWLAYYLFTHILELTNQLITQGG